MTTAPHPTDPAGRGVGVGVSGDDMVPLERDAGRRQRQNKPRESVTAQISVKMFISLLAAGATAATVAAAPVAVADPAPGLSPRATRADPVPSARCPATSSSTTHLPPPSSIRTAGETGLLGGGGACP